jgi:hypothetical protein
MFLKWSRSSSSAASGLTPRADWATMRLSVTPTSSITTAAAAAAIATTISQFWSR